MKDATFTLPDDFTLPEEFESQEQFDALLDTEKAAILAAEEPAADGGAEQAATVQPKPAPEPEPTPLPEVPDTSAAQAEIDKLQAQIDDLMEQYDDGELSRKEFRDKQSEILGKIADHRATMLDAGKVKAERERIEKEQREAIEAKSKAEWNDAVKALEASDPVLMGKDHFDAFNAYVIEQAGIKSHASMPPAQFLKMVTAAYRVKMEAAGTPIPAPKAAKTEGKVKESKPAPDDDDDELAPTSLAFVPAASSNEAEGNGRFQALMNLAGTDAHKYEAALKRMSREERAAFEAWEP